MGNDGRAVCDFCWRRCSIPDGGVGFCGVRANHGGRIETTVYGRVVALAVDPIEKKPLYHVLPGSTTLSVALPGCNFTCDYCQNHHISQYSSSYDQEVSSKNISARQMCGMLVQSTHPSISFTYTEPVVWQDYAMDTAVLVREAGRLVCMVSNGSFSREALARMMPLVDAWNIDVKGDDRFYHTWCSGALSPVLENVAAIASSGFGVLEVTTLLIEGLHTIESIRELGRQLHDAGVQVWHLSRFFPHFRMQNRKPTSERFLLAVLEEVVDLGIPFVYGGNSDINRWMQTRCPGCGALLMESHGYDGKAAIDASNTIKGNRCVQCGAVVYGRFQV